MTYLLPEVSDIEIETPWVVPALLIGLGVCGLLAAFTPRPRESRAATGLDTERETGPRPYVDFDPEPYPDLTLDLAEELAKTTQAQRRPDPPKTVGGAHAINPEDHPLADPLGNQERRSSS